MKRGFTLIELLIVVAIIAILAAIAVPNFLEAQTRSKVSRVHADMRSISTALEAYQVDNNTYPWSYLDWQLVGIDRGDHRLYVACLTTPIAYMTTVPPDPFTIQDNKTASSHKETFWYFRFDEKLGSYSVGPARKGYKWALESFGPARIWEVDSSGKPTPGTLIPWTAASMINSVAHFAPYDPTNGTVSPGHIIRTNKGIFTKVD